jgi:4-carboxymuconolactone decarboxylase
MDEQDRRDAGAKMRRHVLGDAHVDGAAARTTPLTEDFQDLITRYAWGEIWTRPGLDVRARRILVLGTLIALGRFEEFRMHARAAMVEGGFSESDLKEIVLQQAVYCGVPAANTAFEVLREITDSKRRNGVNEDERRRP